MRNAPMTRREAWKILRDAFPGRTVFLTVTLGHYESPTCGPFDRFSYSASAQPGLNGEDCSSWTADTLGGLVRMAQEADSQRAPTDEEADAYFAPV